MTYFVRCVNRDSGISPQGGGSRTVLPLTSLPQDVTAPGWWTRVSTYESSDDSALNALGRTTVFATGGEPGDEGFGLSSTLKLGFRTWRSHPLSFFWQMAKPFDRTWLKPNHGNTCAAPAFLVAESISTPRDDNFVNASGLTDVRAVYCSIEDIGGEALVSSGLTEAYDNARAYFAAWQASKTEANADAMRASWVAWLPWIYDYALEAREATIDFLRAGLPA